MNYNIQNGMCGLFDTAGSLSDNLNVDNYVSSCGGGSPGVQTICNFDGMKVSVSEFNLGDSGNF